MIWGHTFCGLILLPGSLCLTGLCILALNSPSRCILPMTALRVANPNLRAICPADSSPFSQSILSCLIFSSVHPGFWLRLYFCSDGVSRNVIELLLRVWYALR